MANPYALLGQQNASTVDTLATLLASLGPVPGASKKKKNPLLETYQAVEPVEVAMTPADATNVMNQRRAEAAAAADMGTANVPTDNPAVYQKVPAPLPAMGKGSGQSIEQGSKTGQEEGNKSGSKTTMQQLLTMSPEQLQGLYDAFAQTPAFQAQLQGVERLQDVLKMQAGGPVDFLSGPLAGLLQAEFGRDASGFLRGRTVATPGEQNAALIAGLSKLQDDRKDISRAIIDAIGKQRAGSLQEMVYQDFLQKRIDQETTGSKSQDPLKSQGSAAITDQRVKEKEVRDSMNVSMRALAERNNQLKNAEEALATGEWGTVTSMLSVLVKNVGADSGALSDTDIARQLPRTFQGDLTKVAAYLNSNPSEKIDPQVIRGLKNLVAMAKKNVLARYKEQIAREADQFKGSAGFRNIDVDSITAPSRKILDTLSKPPERRKDKTGYDGSGPLPANATPEQKRMRQEFLLEKGGR